MNNLDKAFKAKWVTALRSGEFRQGKDALYNSVHDTYCCLGVLGRVCGIETKNLDWATFVFSVPEHRIVTDQLTIETQQHLARLNDNDGMSFAEIADYIERAQDL